MTTALVLAGGWAHPAEQTGPPTVDALGASGVEARLVTELDAAIAPLDAGVDLLVVHTCRFQMLDARYTAEQRAAFASTTSPQLRRAVRAHLGAGRPLLALHTAVLCFDDWVEWPAIVGGRWDWQRSNHPPPGRFRVEPVVGHPITAGVGAFEVDDELYRFVEPALDSDVVATAVDVEGIRHAQAWVHAYGSARVAHDSLGHDQRSLADPGHRRLLDGLVRWLLRPS